MSLEVAETLSYNKRRRQLMFLIGACVIVTSTIYVAIRKDGNKLQPVLHYFEKENVCTIDYMSYNACDDSKLAADPLHSKIVLEGGPVFLIGERIKLHVTIFDGYNKPKSTGGDHLRARMWSTDVKASSPGRVLDNFNGTYIIVFEALWTGTIQLEVELLYPREIISAVYRTRNMQGTNRCGYSRVKAMMFKKDSCVISNNSKYVDKEKMFCSFTIQDREGHFLHCYKLNDTGDSCSEWINKHRSCWLMDHPISHCERQLSERKMFVIGGNINVTVESAVQSQHIIDIPSDPCTRFNTTQLWLREEPTGFFYKGNWLLRHCRGGTANVGICLQNTTILLLGDSTLFPWRTYLWENLSLDCVILKKGRPPVFSYQKWQDTLRCHCKEYNITFIWVPVASNGPIDVYGYYSRIFRYLDTADRRFKLIVVITVFLHLDLDEFARFRAHMVSIRAIFEEILEQFLHSKFFIKMPHTHRPFEMSLLERNMMIGRSDFVGYVFTCIIKDVFKGMYEKVILLNNKDATIAIKNIPSHPEAMIVTNMVKQLMSYICFIPYLKMK